MNVKKILNMALEKEAEIKMSIKKQKYKKFREI